MDIYEPAEDSYLLQKQVQKYAIGRVLDVGTGSGIQAITAASHRDVREVVAVDINPKAIKELQEKNIKKINTLQSNLFENVHGKFNLIIFNPPYLPQDKGIEDAALYGGKKGWEITERFLDQVSNYLFADGTVLLLFSTLTNKEKIEEILQHNLLEFEEVSSQKIAFETLYVYKITKSSLLRKIEAKAIHNIKYFSKGKRGLIYTGTFDNNSRVKSHFPSKKDHVKVAIKVKNPDSLALQRMENETVWLKALNKQGIGPRLLTQGDGFLVYKFVEGEFILDWIKKATKNDTVSVLKDILHQCLALDEIKVNKEEMHHPHKHILITKNNKPIFIDFERCHKTITPQNVTQVLEFFRRLQKELTTKGIVLKEETLKETSQEYKKEYNSQIIKDFMKSF